MPRQILTNQLAIHCVEGLNLSMLHGLKE